MKILLNDAVASNSMSALALLLWLSAPLALKTTLTALAMLTVPPESAGGAPVAVKTTGATDVATGSGSVSAVVNATCAEPFSSRKFCAMMPVADTTIFVVLPCIEFHVADITTGAVPETGVILSARPVVEMTIGAVLPTSSVMLERLDVRTMFAVPDAADDGVVREPLVVNATAALPASATITRDPNIRVLRSSR